MMPYPQVLVGEEILTASASIQLSMLLLKITSEALAENVRCRQALLAALSASLGCETLAVAVGR